MKIETLINLVGGELLNSPFISEVTSFTDSVDSVTRGSCFFVTDGNDIEKAVEKGAYAIVSTEYETVTDAEIAWIKVASLQKTVTDIFRYENLQTTVYYCDEITEEIISKMKADPNIIILKNHHDLLESLNLNDKYLITSKREFSELANTEILLPQNINLEKRTLFISRYKTEEINLPYVYKDEFSRAVKFFEDNNLKYSLDFKIDRFKPVFIDYLFREAEYGESEKVLIKGIKNDRFFFRELNYLIENTKHAKTVIVNEESKELLKKGFNFAMLVDFDVPVSKEYAEEGLFD